MFFIIYIYKTQKPQFFLQIMILQVHITAIQEIIQIQNQIHTITHILIQITGLKITFLILFSL